MGDIGRRAVVIPVIGLTLLAMFTLTSGAFAQTTVRYQDKTSETGLALEDDPIGSAAMEASGDGLQDLQFHYASWNADFFESNSILNGFPQWTKNTSGFYDPGEVPAPGSLAPVTLDYDNDGIMDLFIAAPSVGGRLYRGTGSGFEDVTSTVSASGLSADYTGAITAGDYDGDGWTDLIAASGGTVYLHRNLGVDGNGNHQGIDNSAQLLYTDVAFAGAVAFLDIDDDGDLDLFIGDKSGGSLGSGTHNALLINQGGDPVSWGSGSLPHTLANEDLGITGVAVADIFQDTSGVHPELVLAGTDRHLFRNDAGDLEYETSFGTNSSYDGSVRILDADLDGALDVLHFAESDGALLHRQTTRRPSPTSLAPSA